MARTNKERNFIVGVYFDDGKYCTISVPSPDDDPLYKTTLCRAVDTFVQRHPDRIITGVTPIGNDWRD